MSTNYPIGIDGIDKPEKVAAVMNGVFALKELAEEYVYLLCLNKKNTKITGIFEISHGTVDRAILGVREIFIRVLLSGASNLIIAHNHPSQSVIASKEDIQIKKGY